MSRMLFLSACCLLLAACGRTAEAPTPARVVTEKVSYEDGDAQSWAATKAFWQDVLRRGGRRRPQFARITVWAGTSKMTFLAGPLACRIEAS